MNIDLEIANEYFQNKLKSEKWFELTNEQKNAALTEAINIIDKQPFLGKKLNVNQSEAFPRIYNDTVIEIPEDVIKSILEEAYSLISNVELSNINIPDGIQSLSLGSASMTFKGKADTIKISPEAKFFLEGWLKKGFDIAPEKFKEVY